MEAERSSDDVIVVETAITEGDFEKVWLSLPQTRYRFKLVGLAAISAAVAVAAHLLARSAGGSPGPFPWAYVLAAFATPPLVGWVVWNGRVRWAKNAVSDLRAREGIHFRFDAEGVAMKLPGRSLTWAWDSLARSLETSDAFVVYMSPISLIVVPKRAISAPDQTRLRAIFQERVPHRPLRGEKMRTRTIVLWSFFIVVLSLVVWRILDQ